MVKLLDGRFFFQWLPFPYRIENSSRNVANYGGQCRCCQLVHAAEEEAEKEDEDLPLERPLSLQRR